MKTLKFKDGGVLWRLATFYGPLSEGHALKYGSDICTFTRAVLKGLLVVLLITAGYGLVAAALGDFGVWALSSIAAGTFLDAQIGAMLVVAAAVVAAIFGTAAGLFCGARYVYEEYQDWRGRVPQKPTQLEQMYRAWKDKYCVPVEFKDAA